MRLTLLILVFIISDGSVLSDSTSDHKMVYYTGILHKTSSPAKLFLSPIYSSFSIYRTYLVSIDNNTRFTAGDTVLVTGYYKLVSNIEVPYYIQPPIPPQYSRTDTDNIKKQFFR